MLGRKAIDQCYGVGELCHRDDRAEIFPRRPRHVGARQGFELRLDRRFDIRRQFEIVGDQDRLCAGVMLGLRQQVCRDPIGIAGLVGENENFRRPGDHVDADLAEHQALGRPRRRRCPGRRSWPPA